MSVRNTGNEFTCYLAGAMSGLTFEEMNNWRKEVKEKLMTIDFNNELNVINPTDFFNFEYKYHQNEREVRDFDLRMVTNSDFIIVNLKHLNHSIGTAIELHEAYYHHHIPVYGYGSKKDYKKLHPWIQENITRYDKDLDSIIHYISKMWWNKRR